MKTLFKFLLAICATLILNNSIQAREVSQRTLNNGNLVLEDIPEIPNQIVTQLNRYQNTRAAAFRTWSSNSKSLYVSTRFGDVSQLHRLDQPGGARRQITFFDEPIGSVTAQPGGDLIAFTMDAGGSENAQVFLLDTESGESTMISDGESRYGVLSWNRDGSALIYQSTRRNGAANDLWMVKMGAPAEASLVLEASDGSWWGAVDWSTDNQSVLVQQYVSVTDSRIHLLDLQSKELTLLQGSEQKPSVNYAVGFDRSGQGYYFTSDQNGDFTELAHAQLDSSSATFLTADIDWNIENVSLNNRRDQLAFSVNAGGVSEVYLMDSRRQQYSAVRDLPIGTAGGLGFSPDDKNLALTLNTATSPSDTFVLALKSNKQSHGDLTRWTYSEVGGLDTGEFSAPELIQYDSFDQLNGAARQIPAFIYRPKSQAGPVPVIVSIHGGPESQYRPRFSSSVQMWMKQLGAAVIAPNVRGSSGYGTEFLKLDNGFKREGSVKDIGALLDWIAKQDDLDQDRVILIGGSYGGYMVLASAVHYSDRLLGAVDIVGISNFVTFLQNTKDYRRDLRRVEYGDERDPKMYEHLQAISPSNNVDKITIPMFVVQGNNDPRVPVSEAEQIVAALRKQGNQVWYMNALNEGHGYRKKENRDVYQQAVVMFMQSLLASEK